LKSFSIIGNPVNQERPVSDSSAPSIITKLFSSTPLLEKPAAASRLDEIIHQSQTNNITDPSSKSYYNLAPVHHHDDEPLKNSDIKPKRSSSSSSSSSSVSTSIPTDKYNLASTNNPTLPPKNSNLHRSLESIPRRTSQTEQTLKSTNKAASLETGIKPVGYDDPGSIYVTPQEAPHPASEFQDAIKGWLRKQNRGKIS